MIQVFAARVRKGKKNLIDEKCQLCKSFLDVLKDSFISNGQNFVLFWERFLIHYNLHRLLVVGE
jgi:hypothetical protein